jgi:glycosyltransferase 2 family protein
VPRTAYAALGLFTCAFAAMGLFYWARDLARRTTHLVVGFVSERLATWVTGKIEHVADGLSFLPSPSHGLPFFRDTLLYWVGNVLLAYVGMRGCGVPVTLTQTMVIQGVMALGILVPSGPGFFGAYQLSGFCALAMFFYEPVVLGPGAAFLFVSYSVQIVLTLLSMLVGALLMRRFAPSPARSSNDQSPLANPE